MEKTKKTDSEIIDILLSKIVNINEVKLKFRKDITEYVFKKCNTNFLYSQMFFEHTDGLIYSPFVIIKEDKLHILYFKSSNMANEDPEDNYTPSYDLMMKIMKKFDVKFSSPYVIDVDDYFVCKCGNDKFRVRFVYDDIYEHVFTCSECKNEIIDYVHDDEDDDKDLIFNEYCTGFKCFIK